MQLTQREESIYADGLRHGARDARAVTAECIEELRATNARLCKAIELTLLERELSAVTRQRLERAIEQSDPKEPRSTHGQADEDDSDRNSDGRARGCVP